MLENMRGLHREGKAVRRKLTYEDAVRILGGGEHRLMGYLDRASAVGMLAVGGFNFFEARQEILRLGGQLVTKLSERLRGIDRLTRTERLLAAHVVIVTTAYFDALGDAVTLLGPAAELQITAADQLSLMSGESVDARWNKVVDGLAGSLLPSPMQSHELTTSLVCDYYRGVSEKMYKFVRGLAFWDEVDETQRDRFSKHLWEDALPLAAALKYDEYFQRLVVDCPEFAVWVGLAEHRATRDEVRAGLTALENVLDQVASGALPDARRDALSRAYRAALHKPITVGGELSADLQIPTLGEGYLDHRFKVAEASGAAEPGRDSWWDDVPTRDDIHTFLAAYLSAHQAYQAPLLVLGQPGSGKSVLTRVLAARLPAADFLPVRVELRQTPAEQDLQFQIEFAVRQVTGEDLSWPRLVESAAGALPVVLLDGFDELLQATGVSQTDFLLKVAAFQEREADQGRPVAVVVTSRIAVANRAALPAGALALRLEPFDDEQIATWLDIWRRVNVEALARHELRALPVEIALQHRELAEQPLLLLMLALHDANANVLQQRGGQLSRTELYEQLLTDFARREVGKQVSGLRHAELERAVEQELLRLSIVAFAMFNRRSQWVSEADLSRDLAALLGDRADARRSSGMHAPLTAAQIVVGRFFFVHEAKATRDGRPLQTYEFLHATFGEFLVARLVACVLTDIVDRETAATRLLPGSVDDGFLHALLSFAVLTARAPIVTFLDDLLGRLTQLQREVAKELLLSLHRTSLYARAESAYAAYEPSTRPLADRLAIWSANLVLLAVLVGGEVMGSELFDGPLEEVANNWRDEAMMWRARLTSEESSGLVNTVGMERLWVGAHRDVRLLLNDRTSVPARSDLSWTYNVHPGGLTPSIPMKWNGHVPSRIERKRNFTASKSGDMTSHALEPIGDAFPSIANVLFPDESGRLISPTHALLAALVAPFRKDASKSSAYSDLVVIVHALKHANETGPESADEYEAFMESALAVLWLAKHRGHLPAATLNELQALVNDLDDPS